MAKHSGDDNYFARFKYRLELDAKGELILRTYSLQPDIEGKEIHANHHVGVQFTPDDMTLSSCWTVSKEAFKKLLKEWQRATTARG